MKTKTELPKNHQLTDTPIDLSMALLINGKSLESQPVKHSTPAERKFKSEKEFNELVINNSKMLFGKNTLLIDATNSPLECYVLLDFNEVEKHKLYFVDITLSKQSFWELFARITRLFSLLSLPDYSNRLSELLWGVISENRPLKKELNVLVGEDIAEYLRMVLISKPFVLLLTDQERPELAEIMMTYSSNWGKFVKPILLRKYADNGDLFFTMSPAFVDIDFTANGKAKKANQEKREKLTEADHLENTSDSVRDVYQKIKTDILKEDASIEFNPKQYYISMRKGRNLAFSTLRKIDFSCCDVPEKETRKQIKHHEVKALAESVQKFWNGGCCTIIIESMEKVEEVIALLKKLIQ